MQKSMMMVVWLAMVGVMISAGTARAQSPQESQVLRDYNEDATWRSQESYIKFIVPAAINAARILAGLGDPIFASPEGVAVQTLTEKPVAVSVFFASEAAYPEHMRHGAHHSLCQVLPVSEKATIKSKYIISCNHETLRKFDILCRAAHSSSYIKARMKNDWAFMQLLKDIETHPANVMSEASPDVDNNHMNLHMSFFLVYLLAHESWHIRNQSAYSFHDAPGAGPLLLDSDLASRIVCRNYREFARRGKQFEIALSLIPLSEEGTTKDPTERKYFETTRSIWKEELEADKYAAGLLARLILMLRKQGIPENGVQRIFSQTLQHFGLLSLMLWHSRIQPFAEKTCEQNAWQDYFLTRCMCVRKDRYVKTVQLFGATHPPIVLRMYAAAKEYLKKLGIDKDVSVAFPGHTRHLVAAVNWFRIIDVLTDVPLKLSMPVCLGTLDYIADSGRLAQVIPDLAGFFGTDRSTVYPGYPADEGALMSECHQLTDTDHIDR